MLNPMLKLENISLIFPGMDRPVLHDISIEVLPKEFLILLGSNGSGKSSLLHLMSGDLKSHGGGIECSVTPKAQGYLTQNTHESLFHDLSVLENVCMNELKVTRASFSSKTVDEHLFYKGYLEAFHPKLPLKMDTLVKQLSGGEKQSLALALALRHDPSLLLLDEHTSALDPRTAKSLMEMTASSIQKTQTTAVMTTHNMDHALTYGTRIIALKHGKIALDVKGQDKQQLTREQLMALYY